MKIDYDKLKEDAKAGVSKTGNSFLLNSLYPTHYPNNPSIDLVKIGFKFLKKLIFDSDDSSSVENDWNNIETIIKTAKENGVDELEIKISKELGDKMEISSTLPIELPVNASIKLDKKDSQNYHINIKFKEINYHEQADVLERFAELLEKGIITKEEFKKKKDEIFGN